MYYGCGKISMPFTYSLKCCSMQIPGRENLLHLPYSACPNISIAPVNECGISTFLSPAQVIPPPGIYVL